MAAPPLSPELLSLMAAASRRALAELDANGSLMPFSLTQIDDARTLTQYQAETLPAALAEARETITVTSTEIALYVIGCAAPITLDEARGPQPVILLEAGERGMEQAALVAQPFSLGGGLLETSPEGDPRYLGPLPLLLT